MGWYRADVLRSRVAFTDRRGGVSSSPFDSLNLALPSDAIGDSEAWVAENRSRATALLGPAALPWVPMHQVHGAAVTDGGLPEADAVVVTEPGRVGAVLVADCAPIAIVGEGGIAAVHAGWRGLLEGVVGAAVAALDEAGVEPRRAILGPCIRACCYEFGAADLSRLEERFGPAARGVTQSGVPALDLAAAVRRALAEAGVDRFSEIGICTACSPDYFSHRRDSARHGTTGRQSLLVTVLP